MRTLALSMSVSIAGLAVFAATVASAEPLVKIEGGAPKPGVVTAWKGSGNKIELTVRDGVDAKSVAEAIESGVEKVQAKVKGGKVLVVGKAETDLLRALSEVDFGGGGDLGALAQAAMQGESEDSGSSLRAKKKADVAKLLKDKNLTASGKVVEVAGANFPEVIVTIQIIRAPSGELGNKVRKGAKIKFKPALKTKGKDVDWSDEDTQENAGAWYLQKNDSVTVKIGKEDAGTFEALILTRG